ncbi:MAG TPA: HD domain-containing protein, partial [Spirochaetia bacterium]|nr:HD domain-containing protein [Spirochaetia bacterium]
PEMIGHLLRNEGRYIRILESMLDVEISIEESPEGFSLSSPDPLNREITRATLDRLFKGGRINPPKIKETVDSVRKEIWETMHREAINVLRELGIKDFKPEALLALGRLLYRYSYGQNNLYHSKEVALLAGMMAVELGGDPQIAKRGGLLHDIGKGFALDGKAHVEMGLELAEKWGEDPRVINAIASHHDDFEPTFVESVIVQIADAISGARPGARRETIANYLDRVEKLESIAGEFEGVDNAYAIYAGRELRILVNSDKIDDDKAKLLAVGIAQKVEERLSYPGKIKVTVIREMKVSSFTH